MDRQERTNRRAFLVSNPQAGTGTALLWGRALQERMTEQGWDFREHLEQPGEDVAALVKQVRQEGFNYFIAAGGDGTVSGVAGGLVGSPHPLAILPAGTGNVLARDLKLPLDQEGAIALAAGPGPHELRSLDAMEVDGRYFFLNLGVGLNAAVMRDTTPREKRAFGAAAYVWTAVRKAVVPHQASFRVVVDGEETRSRASDVIIMNSPAIGGPALRLDPKACPDDGRLEVFIIQSRGLGEYLLLASRVLLGWQRIDRRFFQRNCYREVQVTTKPSLPVQADGEALGETPIRVELRSKAVQVVVPPLKEGGKRPLQALLGLARQEKEERG